MSDATSVLMLAPAGAGPCLPEVEAVLAATARWAAALAAARRFDAIVVDDTGADAAWARAAVLEVRAADPALAAVAVGRTGDAESLDVFEWRVDPPALGPAVERAADLTRLRRGVAARDAGEAWAPFAVAEAPRTQSLLREISDIAGSGVRWIAIAGEPGSGRLAAARAVHDRIDSGGHRAFIAEDARALLAPGGPVRWGSAASGATFAIRPGSRLFSHAPSRVFAALASRLPDARLCLLLRPDEAKPIPGDESMRLLTVPPLRARRADIPGLASHFLVQAIARDWVPAEGVSDEALDRLRARVWPGNVRELRDVVWRAAMAARHARLEPADFGFGPEPVTVDALPLEDIERLLLQRAMRELNGNLSAVGRQLGFSRASLFRKVRAYDL